MDKKVIELIKDDLDFLEKKLNSIELEGQKDLLDAILNLTVIFKEFVRQLGDGKTNEEPKQVNP